jgi:DNA invertase Pin-like site-specific DNA recombinase
VIAEWDRATRSMWDGLQIIKAVIDAGATVKVLDRSYIDLTTPMGRGFMAMMSAMAEDERLRIVKRTHEGRQIARANGVKMGRKPKLNAHQIREARQRLAKGEKTRDLAKIYAVSISTISRLAG